MRRRVLPLRSGPALRLAPLLALLLAGCVSVSPPPAPRTPSPGAPVPRTPDAAPPASSPQSRTAAAEALAIEQRWLQSWFRGTPVRITQRNDGTLAVDVPREFSFDAGRSQVKPALAAVLDKVAESLRRRPGARLTLLSAPGDVAGSAAPATLALQRAASVQRHLRNRGVPLARLGEPVADDNPAVQLRIGTAAP